MSPEQARAEDVDARTDVYSLGCMTFEMLTGQLPFADYGLDAIAHRESESIPAPSAVCPDLPVALDDVVARALAPMPDDRFQSTTAFAQALGAAAVPVDGAAHVPARQPLWRRPWVAAAAAIAVVATGAAVEGLRRASTERASAAATVAGAPNGPPSGAAPAASGPALAVLPFENVGACRGRVLRPGCGRRADESPDEPSPASA